MKKLIAVLSILTTLITLVSTETRANEEKWKPDEGRSVSLFVFIADNTLHICSDNQWDNVTIQIQDLNEIIFYFDNLTIQGAAETIIPLPDLPEGNYQVILTRNNQPISWYLTK